MIKKTRVEARRKIENFVEHANLSLLSKIEPNKFEKDTREEGWIDSTEE